MSRPVASGGRERSILNLGFFGRLSRSLRAHFVVLLVLIGSPAGVIGIGVYIALSETSASFGKLAKEVQSEIRPVMELQLNMRELESRLPLLLLSDGSDLAAPVTGLMGRVGAQFARLEGKHFEDEGEREHLDMARAAWIRGREPMRRLLSAARGAPDRALDRPLMDEAMAQIDKAVQSLDRIHLGAIEEINRYYSDALDLKQHLVHLLVWVLPLLALAVVVAAVVAVRVFFRPLERLRLASQRLTEGDLACRMPDEPSLEFKEVSQTFNRMADELELQRDRLRETAMRDGLTGLFNRLEFAQRLRVIWQDAVRKNRPLAVLMLDVDHFKRVNDTHGHLVGDRVLAGVAEALRTAVRQADVVARYGGEEFVMLLPETDAAHARIVAERVLERLRGLVHQSDGGGVFGVTASIGVAFGPDGAASEQELLQRADRLLYQAKHDGRNCARFDHPETSR